jgi:hypothetical protein
MGIYLDRAMSLAQIQEHLRRRRACCSTAQWIAALRIAATQIPGPVVMD